MMKRLGSAIIKAGIIRCQQTEDMCPGGTDLRIAREGKGGFRKTGPVEIIGFLSCGGCPGKKAVHRAELLVNDGAKIIVFASCISKGNPIGFACPHFKQMRQAVRKKLPHGINILDWTH